MFGFEKIHESVVGSQLCKSVSKGQALSFLSGSIWGFGAYLTEYDTQIIILAFSFLGLISFILLLKGIATALGGVIYKGE
jgi:hypothetical protein